MAPKLVDLQLRRRKVLECGAVGSDQVMLAFEDIVGLAGDLAYSSVEDFAEVVALPEVRHNHRHKFVVVDDRIDMAGFVS